MRQALVQFRDILTQLLDISILDGTKLMVCVCVSHHVKRLFSSSKTSLSLDKESDIAGDIDSNSRLAILFCMVPQS
uniref:Uncharacterized protein n=1 Tax=Romanomermis culicivorax TaxID=13658 RepID=A0A915KD26_ROMCU